MSNIGLRRQSTALGLSLVLMFAATASDTQAVAQSQEATPKTSDSSSSGYTGQGMPDKRRRTAKPGRSHRALPRCTGCANPECSHLS